MSHRLSNFPWLYLLCARETKAGAGRTIYLRVYWASLCKIFSYLVPALLSRKPHFTFFPGPQSPLGGPARNRCSYGSMLPAIIAFINETSSVVVKSCHDKKFSSPDST